MNRLTFETRRPRLPTGLGFKVPTRVPSGKGIFVSRLEDAGSPEQVAARCVWANLKWVAMLAIWQDKAGWVKLHNVDLFHAYGAALHARGVRPWIWGFPHPYKSGEFVAATKVAAEQAHAVGVILDVEAPWLSATASHGVALVEGMRAALPQAMLGFTSYPKPSWVPGLPWDAFLGCDFGMPQVYDAKGERGPTWQAQGVEAYQAAGFAAVVPILPTFGANGESPQSIVGTFDRTPRPDGSVCWWSWENSDKHDNWGGLRAVMPPVPVIPTPGAFAG